MAGPRDQLIQIIKDLKLPISPEEVKGQIENLNDNEVELLATRYREIKNYFVEIEKLAEKADPKRYSEVKNTHNQKFAKLDREYKQNIEKSQEQIDNELDKIEDQAKKDYDDLIENLERRVGILEKEYDNFYEKLKF